MRYIREELFVAANGGHFTINGVKGTGLVTEQATVSEMLHWLLNAYHPQVFLSNGQPILGIPELRGLNRAIDIFEGQPQEDGHYRLEDQDFAVLRRVVTVMAPVLTPRNAPLLEDILEAAPKSLTLRVVEESD